MNIPHREPDWLERSGIVLETYASINGVGGQMRVSISGGTHPSLFRSEHEWLAAIFGVSEDIIKDWQQWVNDGSKCKAYGSSGQRCQCISTPYAVRPDKYDPEDTPYCRHHKNPGSRGMARDLKQRSTAGYIYLLHAVGTNRYKIGLTKNVVRRIAALAKQSPFPVEVIHHYQTNDMKREESLLHDAFKEYRVHGEWFELPDFAVSEICSLEDCA
jgi:hypothetical protein